MSLAVLADLTAAHLGPDWHRHQLPAGAALTDNRRQLLITRDPADTSRLLIQVSRPHAPRTLSNTYGPDLTGHPGFTRWLEHADLTTTAPYLLSRL